MAFLGQVTAIVRTKFSDSVLDPKPLDIVQTRFVSAGRRVGEVGDRDTVGQIDTKVWDPCGSQDATQTIRTNTRWRPTRVP